MHVFIVDVLRQLLRSLNGDLASELAVSPTVAGGSAANMSTAESTLEAASTRLKPRLDVIMAITSISIKSSAN
jgi:hypothetical protein